jgi:hypothetical protein
MASDVHSSRPGYLELAAAYEQLAKAAERCEAMSAVDSDTPPEPSSH